MERASLTGACRPVHRRARGPAVTWRSACYPSSMRFLPLTACALLFALPAKADKFWLSDPAAEKNATAGSSPNVVDGVLIAESDEGYHVRIVGGEILLPKKSVFKIEKDGLTLDSIVKAEKDAAEALAAANRERELTQATARKAREIQVLEAAARRGGRAVDAALPPASVDQGPVFDPVLGVVRTGGLSQGDLLADAQLAYELTKDRRYLRVVRQLRRLR